MWPLPGDSAQKGRQSKSELAHQSEKTVRQATGGMFKKEVMLRRVPVSQKAFGDALRRCNL